MEIIYKLTSPSGNVYIGRTSNFQQRMNQHEKRSNSNGEKKVLYDAIRKYGWDSFTKEIIAEVNSNDAPEVEHLMMLKYNSVKNGYNMTYSTYGGDTWEGRRDSKEFLNYVALKRKQSIENNGFAGKTHTDEAKKKMIHRGDKNGMHGKQHTEEAKLLQKEKAKGRYSLEWFIERYGEEDGTIQYNERCLLLKNRKMTKDDSGRFVKKL